MKTAEAGHQEQKSTPPALELATSDIGKTAQTAVQTVVQTIGETGPEQFVSGCAQHEKSAGARNGAPREKPAKKSAGNKAKALIHLKISR